MVKYLFEEKQGSDVISVCQDQTGVKVENTVLFTKSWKPAAEQRTNLEHIQG